MKYFNNLWSLDGPPGRPKAHVFRYFREISAVISGIAQLWARLFDSHILRQWLNDTTCHVENDPARDARLLWGGIVAA
jgi:hypothetical protein